MTQNRKRVTFRMTEEQYKKLAREAETLGISINALIVIKLSGGEHSDNTQ